MMVNQLKDHIKLSCNIIIDDIFENYQSYEYKFDKLDQKLSNNVFNITTKHKRSISQLEKNPEQMGNGLKSHNREN